MIVFYSNKTGEIIGHVEGRVFDSRYLNIGVETTNHQPGEIQMFIIGYEDTGETEELTNDKGEIQTRSKYKEHNLHLWKWQEFFENPKNKRPHDHKVRLDKTGSVIDFALK